MRKSAAALAIAAFLIGSTVSAVNAASPKAGDSCPTGGMSQISDGKRYLC